MAIVETKGWVRHRMRVGLVVTVSLCPVTVDAVAAPTRPSGSTCEAWLATTVARVEKLAEQKWRDTIVAALGDDSCTAVPANLRRAARDVRRSGSGVTRADRLLADAASAVLGPTCPIPDPASDAHALAATCPLPKRPEFQLSDTMLGDLRAVDYALLNALAKSLLVANAYGPSAERLIMDFTLSAGLRGEQMRKPKRSTKRPR